MKTLITASIVLYETNSLELTKTIDSIFKNSVSLKLYLIDNSLIDTLRFFSKYDSRIVYIHNPSNPGFGASHNIAIQKSIEKGMQYHFIVNPDVYFDDDVISSMILYMQEDEKIGMMMPQILNIDGTIQNLPKLLPNPFSILWRKFKKPAKLYKKFIDNYELRNIPPRMIYDSPLLSGCFTLLNLSAVKKVGIYDDSFFMYFEDWDLSRRMHQHYRTIYYPVVSVYHGYDSGANKNSKLFKIFINSAITYFNKWGWFFDSERKIINKKALSQFK